MSSIEWDEDAAFRATSLMHFAPGDADVVRQFGGLLSRLALLPDYQRELAGSPVRIGLSAAIADLRYLARFLAILGTHQTASGLSREEIRLSEIAATFAPEVEEVARRLEASLSSFPLL